MSERMAEVLAAHWSASTHTDSKPFVDKCDGCGTVIRSWGDATPAFGVDLLAAHQAAALTAAGFGPVKEAAAKALEDAADDNAVRSDTLLKTMQNMADSREYELADIVRYGAFSAEAKATESRLRARAAAVRGEG